ncbi:MAG TPA: glycosyl transferase [Pseudolabrys sp.]|nr:glycosyl transferase [Pseudolabrys sp.]
MGHSGASVTFGSGVLILAAAAVLCFGLLSGLLPLLARYALAKPNARSSHRVPTPQGGGVAVIAATVAVVAGAIATIPLQIVEPRSLALVLAAVVALAVLGAADDLRPMQAAPRLFLQAVAVAAAVAALPPEIQVFPAVPWWLDRLLVLLGGVWLVNVANFMDGIDWMTVAEFVPVTAGLVLLGMLGALPVHATAVAAALCGAIIGFAPFNRPVARLFLGDVGSLPAGLLLGWMLALLAGEGHLAAAILLPLYYLADATITLMRRILNGERITQAHRCHFYQRALDGGLSVYQITACVFALNLALTALAIITIGNPSREIALASLAAGVMLVGLALWRFEHAGRK